VKKATTFLISGSKGGAASPINYQFFFTSLQSVLSSFPGDLVRSKSLLTSTFFFYMVAGCCVDANIFNFSSLTFLLCRDKFTEPETYADSNTEKTDGGFVAARVKV
jgi:hypothetical protein